MRILVTPRSLTRDGLSTPELAPLRERGYELVPGPAGRTPTEAELLALVPGCSGWLAGVEPISEAVLAAADGLRVISRNGAGADAIDREAAERRGVEVRTAPGANARGVAELAVLLMLAGLRSLPHADRAMHAGRWERSLGRELADCTVGVVGLGAIGRLVAGFVTAFGARVIAHDPYVADARSLSLSKRADEIATPPSLGPGSGRDGPITPPELVEGGTRVPLVDLVELFTRSDIVTLHCPPTSDGSPLVTAELLNRLPDGAVLVNTARSALVDDAAALAALESGRLASFAVDAFDTEPPEPSLLLMHERTITTPHLGAYTTGSVRRAAQDAVGNLLAILDPTLDASTERLH